MINIKEYLNKVADVVASDLPDDDGEIYVSKVDGSYITRVGMEDKPTVEFLYEHDVTQLQGNVVANIGYSESEMRWYGWSHRAISGFGIGSEVTQEDCGYIPVDADDALQDAIRFWSDEDKLNIRGEHVVNDNNEKVMLISWEYSDNTPNNALRGKIGSVEHPYPEEYGKGCWIAQTMADAKQMAKDFAESVG